jgi:hypothetical protein
LGAEKSTEYRVRIRKALPEKGDREPEKTEGRVEGCVEGRIEESVEYGDMSRGE